MSRQVRSPLVLRRADISHRFISWFAAGILLVAGVDAQTARADHTASWEPLSSMNLTRQEFGAARIGDNVYAVGGLDGGFLFHATDTVEVYDIANDEWSSVPPLPQPRHHSAVAAHGGLLFVIGGYPTGLTEQRSEVYVYTPQQDEGGEEVGVWLEAAPLPGARAACWGVTLNDRIYVFGGENDAGDAQASTFIFDPVADTWSIGADMPTARGHLTASVAGDLIYVIGGRDGNSQNQGEALDVNEVYDPANDQWQTLAPMPTARSWPTQVTFDGKIYVAGGETPDMFPDVFDVHEVYEVATDTWEGALSLPQPLHGASAVALDDRILIAGGGQQRQVDPTDMVYSFEPGGEAVPAASTWGIVALALAIISLATILIRRRGLTCETRTKTV